MDQAQSDKLTADTAKWLKDHVYTELTNANGVEVWRCKKPGTVHLAFDICITRFGITVMGDIGSLAFSVGASYGIPFLAGTDEDYIHGKLEASSKATDFDRASFIWHVEGAICDLLARSRETAPDWMDEYPANAGRGSEIETWLMDNCERDHELSTLVVALREARAFEADTDPSKAHEWVADHEELLEVGDSWEWDLRKPTDSVWRRLYRVRHAARMIQAQKIAAQESKQATEYCYSMGPEDDQWSDEGLAEFVSDRELTAGTVIQRGVVDRSQAHSFLPDANAVLEYMAERAGDENSEFCDGFPNITKEQEATLAPLLEPLKAWADRNCEVTFYTVPNDSIESYVVTSEDVVAGEAYRKALDAEVAA